MLPVERPFGVGPEVGDRGLDLDDGQRAVGCERGQIGPPSIGQTEFGDAREVHRPQHAPHALCHLPRRFRLPPVLGQLDQCPLSHRHGHRVS